MTEHTSLLYRLDEQDNIIFISETWLPFALANDGVGLAPPQVLQRSLYDFITGETTRLLYQNIIQRVRTGHSIRFPFRCDAPTRRRLLEMTIGLDANNLVEFATRTLWIEDRPPVPLFASVDASLTVTVRMCGWCKRMELPNQQWIELEEAVAQLELFEQADTPQVSHGICETCSAMLKKSWTTGKSFNVKRAS